MRRGVDEVEMGLVSLGSLSNAFRFDLLGGSGALLGAITPAGTVDPSRPEVAPPHDWE